MTEPAPPPEVAGDAKDWTWVLDRPCPECGFDASSFDRHAVPAGLRANAEEWVAVLNRDPAALRRRSEPGVWSPLEYACHVRDVCRIYHERLTLMQSVDGPRYPNWDQDATAVEYRYDLADVGGSDGAAFTIDTFSRYLLHDPVHHLWDVRRQLP